MSSDWTKTTIGALCARVFSGGTPKSTNPDYYDGGIPWLRTKEVNYTKIYATEGSLTASGLAASAAKLVPVNTVIVAMYGNGDTAGRAAIAKVPLATNQACCNLVVDGQKADYRFVYYYLRSRYRSLVELKNGGAQQNLNSQLIRSFPIQLPDLGAQRKVADLLEELDDRIDLLRQTNATLEAIAQALFKSWFIDFDPVRAKAEGHEPEGMDAATAALFPAEFAESALGLIPRGWTVSTLAAHVIAERGLSYKGAGLCSGSDGLPMHNLNSVLEGGGYKYAGIKHYRGDYKERHLAIAGDIIMANTEQGHDHRLIGFPAIVPARFPRAIYSHHIFRVRLRPDSPLTTSALYYMLMAPYVREQIIGCANGSTVNMLKSAGLEIPQFVCPPAGLAQAFESLVRPMRANAEANVERAETLSALRDTLLPRLISGQLRLPEAQAQVEESLA